VTAREDFSSTVAVAAHALAALRLLLFALSAENGMGGCAAATHRILLPLLGAGCSSLKLLRGLSWLLLHFSLYQRVRRVRATYARDHAHNS